MPDLAAPAADLDRFCTACGYNLRGIQSDRCPECGTEYDYRQATVTQIPWAKRGAIGRINAFVRTVMLATFRPKILGLETQNPVSLADAQSFRRVVAVFAAAPWLWFAGSWYRTFTLLDRTPWDASHRFESVLQWGGFALLLLTVAAWIFFCTAVPSYLFHPRNRSIVHQNRAIALSYYACGPMVFMAIPAIAIHFYVAGRWYEHRIHDPVPYWAAMAVTFVICVWQLDAIWRAPMRIFAVSMQAGRMRLSAMDLYLPLSWAGLFVIVVLSLNAAYWLVAWMAMSYR